MAVGLPAATAFEIQSEIDSFQETLNSGEPDWDILQQLLAQQRPVKGQDDRPHSDPVAAATAGNDEAGIPPSSRHPLRRVRPLNGVERAHAKQLHISILVCFSILPGVLFIVCLALRSLLLFLLFVLVLLDLIVACIRASAYEKYFPKDEMLEMLAIYLVTPWWGVEAESMQEGGRAAEGQAREAPHDEERVHPPLSPPSYDA